MVHVEESEVHNLGLLIRPEEGAGTLEEQSEVYCLSAYCIVTDSQGLTYTDRCLSHKLDCLADIQMSKHTN